MTNGGLRVGSVATGRSTETERETLPGSGVVLGPVSTGLPRWPWPGPWLPPYPFPGPAERSGPGSDGEVGGDIVEVLDSLYQRPDVRAVLPALSRAFLEMLSRDDEAALAFNEIVGGIPAQEDGGERYAILVVAAVVVGCAAVGGGLGYLSRP
jgi:hypothetical protein